jgi:hypothetical protein
VIAAKTAPYDEGAIRATSAPSNFAPGAKRRFLVSVGGLGMASAVAPPTTIVINAVPRNQTKVASGVNNATASLLAPGSQFFQADWWFSSNRRSAVSGIPQKSATFGNVAKAQGGTTLQYDTSVRVPGMRTQPE